jgi:hypothetical protein
LLSGGGSLVVIVGAVVGVLALVGIVLGLWCVLSRDKSPEEQEDEELVTETDISEVRYTIEGEGDLCPTAYQTHDLRAPLADTEAYDTPFAHDSDEEKGA